MPSVVVKSGPATEIYPVKKSIKLIITNLKCDRGEFVANFYKDLNEIANCFIGNDESIDSKEFNGVSFSRVYGNCEISFDFETG